MYKEQLIILFQLLASRCYQLRVDDLLSIATGLPHCNAVHGKKALLHGVQGYVDLTFRICRELEAFIKVTEFAEYSCASV